MDSLPLSQRFDPYAHGIASGYSDIFTPFLGPPPREAKINNFGKKSVAKWNMPESYVGESEYLGNTIEDAVLTSQDSWYTTRIMPWYRTDNIHLQWTEWDNNVHYMGITPHQAISKVVTQRRTVRKASIVRRGIAAEFENDFVGTPLGRSSFMASLSQMARAFQETGNVEVLRALINCHRSTQIFDRKYGVVADYELDEWLGRKAEHFMAVQKDAFGLEKTNTRIEREQEMWGGEADTWILGREIMDYCNSGVIPEKSLFYLGGQEAVDRVNGRPQNGVAAGNTMGNVRSLQPQNFISGLPVYLAKSYAVDTIGKADLLSRTVEIGIYNLMVDRTRDYTRYRREGRNLRVYNEDIDSWSELDLPGAIQNLGVWTESGVLADPFARNVNGRTGMLNAQVDDDFDFLSFSTGGARQNIEYVGDMSKNWINAGNFEDAAQTMLNVISHHNLERAQQWVMDVESGSANIGNLATAIKNIVGEDNLFFRGGKAAADVLTENFVSGGIQVQGGGTDVPPAGGDDDVPASPRNAEAAEGDLEGLRSRIGVNAAQSAAEKDLILNIAGAAVPDTHKDKLPAIANNTALPWTGRLKALKELALSIHAETPEMMHTSLTTPARIDKYFKLREQEFQERIENGDFGRHGAAAPAPVGARQGSTRLPSRQQQRATPNNPARFLASFPAFAAHVASKSSASSGAAGGRSNIAAAARRAYIGSHQGGGNGGNPGTGRFANTAQMRATDDAARTGPTNATLEAIAAGRYANLATHIADIYKGSAPILIKWLAAIYAASEFTRDRLVSYARNHVYVALGCLLMRNHCTFKTRFGIKVAAGGKAGYTFFGHSNMQIEHEAARKVGMMHYTAYLSAVVLYPKNVNVVEDLFCEKYLGGMGIEYWEPSQYRSGALRRNARSIICAPLPPNVKKLEQKIDARGRWITEHQLGLVTQERFDAPLYPGAQRINLLFGLQESLRKDKSSNRSRTAINFVCWQGMEWYYNPISGKWDDYTVEAGHCGPNVYPGVGKVRNGEAKFVKNCNYEAVH